MINYWKKKQKELLRNGKKTSKKNILKSLKDPVMILEVTRLLELKMMEDITKSKFESGKIANFGNLINQDNYTQAKNFWINEKRN